MTNRESQREGSLLVLALVAGAAAGLVGAIFRLCLEQADRLRASWLHGLTLRRLSDSCSLSLHALPRLRLGGAIRVSLLGDPPISESLREHALPVDRPAAKSGGA
jgi:hypothetical protein